MAIYLKRGSAAIMLAYVFWHQPGDIEKSKYEDALAQFHRQLVRNAPPGFVESYVFWVDPCPWMKGPSYEDWYLIDSFAALGSLNEGAVSDGVRDAHDFVAARAGAGMGGLYAVRFGSANFAERSVVWFDKPRGMSYATLDGFLRDGGWCWQRQLVLGPTPEFCAKSAPAEIGDGVRCSRIRVV